MRKVKRGVIVNAQHPLPFKEQSKEALLHNNRSKDSVSNSDSVSENDIIKLLSNPRENISYAIKETKDVFDLLMENIKAEDQRHIPIITGPTAVMKSSFVKSIAKLLNLRLIETRVSLLERLYVSTVTSHTPANDIDKSLAMISDQFLCFARSSVAMLKNKLETLIDKDKRSNIQKMLAVFEEFSKPPLYFLDEVTHVSKSMRQKLISILTERSFNDLTFKEARFVAAANTIEDPDLKSFYCSEALEEKAFASLFRHMYVDPDAVRDRWVEWAKSITDNNKIPGIKVTNIHDIINSFLENNTDYYYNYSDAKNAYIQKGTPNAFSTTPYPNYRTWAFLSDYLYVCETDNVVSRNIITSLIGKTASELFCSYLSSQGWKFKIREGNSMDEQLEESYKAGIPSMIAAPTGLAKTSRVEKFVQANNAEYIRVDDMNTLGIPASSNFISEVLYHDFVDAGIDVSDKKMFADLDKIAMGSNLPSMVKEYCPNKILYDAIERAKDQGRPLILFFDELSRLQSPQLMSSLFMAISDNTIMDLDFSEVRSQVVAAMIKASGNDRDTVELDPAFGARFSLFVKEAYEDEDAASYLEYLKDGVECGKMAASIYSFLASLEISEVREILAQIEKVTLFDVRATTRTIESFASFLQTTKNRVVKGKILYPTLDHAKTAMSVSNSGDLSKIIGELNNFVSLGETWAGMYNDGGFLEVVGDKGKYEHFDDNLKLLGNVKVAIDLFHNPHPAVSQDELTGIAKNLLKTVIQVDEAVKAKRKTIFNQNLGTVFSENFSDYYNMYEEDSNIQLSDCNTIDNVRRYVKSNRIEDRNTIFERIKEHFSIFKRTIDAAVYVDFLGGIGSTWVNSAERLNDILKTVAEDKQFGDDYFLHIESDRESLLTLFEYLGYGRKIPQKYEKLEKQWLKKELSQKIVDDVLK